MGRNLWKSADGKASIRMQALAGFYCWMTNDMVHRQNDAISYGVGFTGKYRGFTLATNLAGFTDTKTTVTAPYIGATTSDTRSRKT